MKRNRDDYKKAVIRNERVEKKRQDWDMRLEAKKRVAEFKRPAGFNKKRGKGEDEWEDIDEHERDVFDKDGYYDVPEDEQVISTSDMRILDKFKSESNQPAKVGGEGVSLADLIMQKMNAGDY